MAVSRAFMQRLGLGWEMRLRRLRMLGLRGEEGAQGCCSAWMCAQRVEKMKVVRHILPAGGVKEVCGGGDNG